LSGNSYRLKLEQKGKTGQQSSQAICST
jgi:hypothetical protein